jgi:hypothetical protein
LNRVEKAYKAFGTNQISTVEMIASDCVQSCVQHLKSNHWAIIDALDAIALGDEEEKAEASKGMPYLLGQTRNHYLAGLYNAASMDLGAEPPGNNPCPE